MEKVDDNKRGFVEDVGHLEGDGVKDDNEKNGDENVGAEEQRKQRNGGNSVTEK